jgi:hypothetical protein
MRAADWLAQSHVASDFVSTLGQALGGGSPVCKTPRRQAAAGTSTLAPDDEADSFPLRSPSPPLAHEPLDFRTPPDSPLASPRAEAPDAEDLWLEPSRAVASEHGAPGAASPLPPPPPLPPPSQAADGAWDWDVTRLLPPDKRESLHAAAASFRAGLPGGGRNPSALLGTALLGTTDGALRGFAGLLSTGGRRAGSGGGARKA